MKKIIYPLVLIGSLLASFMIAGCGTSSLSLSVLRPADINVHPEVQTIVLVNRYRPEKGKGFWNFMEGLLTGEGIGADRRGADASLAGLSRALSGSPRFNFVTANIEVPGTGTGQFPAPLSRDEVNRICAQFEADAMITVEAFDSDSRLNYSTRVVERKDKEGNKYNETIHKCIADLDVTVGWRFYDGQSAALIDEFRMVEGIQFRAEGRNQDVARNNLPNKDNMVSSIGNKVGDRYAFRIAPIYVRVNRTYYTKAKKDPNIKEGRQRAKWNRWEEAEEFWLKTAESADTKVARRGAYNMAVAAEIRGNLEEALDWTEQAGEMGLKKALEYNRILRRRQMDENRVDQQMQGNQ